MQAMKKVMKEFCRLEASALTARAALLKDFEEAVDKQLPEDDISKFIAHEKQLELTRRHSSAFKFMDEHFRRR